MGMAASQARFLTLTARKSNVEYEGQQVNQQRTSLSNESAGLFNKMMALQVPTPPSATDFYNTRYIFEAGGVDCAITDFQPRTTDPYYDLRITYKGIERTGRNYTSGQYTLNLNPDNTPKSCVMKFNAKDYTCDFQKLERSIVKDKDGNPVKDDSGNYKYQFSYGTEVDSNVNVLEKAISPEKLSDDANEVFYRFEHDNTYYYVSGKKMEEALAAQPAGSTSYAAPLTVYYATDTTVNKTINAIADIPKKTQEGRFEELNVREVKDCDDKALVEALTKNIFDLSLTQVQDDEGYDKAMKDYEYQKMLYERTINDINAQTEIIQQQDRTLELRLKQLDTEQNALNTELEAVKKVIETNVEATFKTFA